MDMRFETWNVRSIYKAGSLRTKMDLREIEWDGMDWIDLALDTNQCRALVKMVMNLLVP
jgi:hypothetical protein